MKAIIREKKVRAARNLTVAGLTTALFFTATACTGQNVESDLKTDGSQGKVEQKLDEQKTPVSRKEEPEKPEQNQEYLLLINKTHPVDPNYVPEDLAPIKYFASDRSEAGRYMRAEAAAQFEKLVEAAEEQGYKLVMTTAYRSYGFQNTLYTNYVANYGEQQANTFSAKPGQSEHQSGLAVDVSGPVVGYALSDAFGDTAEGKWMAQHAHEYGLIIRFPLGKEAITGYQYEPWHLRYVGQPAADEIYAKGITLEEYLGE